MTWTIVRSGLSKKEQKSYPDMIDLKVRAIPNKAGTLVLQCGLWDQNNQFIELQDDIQLARSDVVAIGLLERIYAQKDHLYLKYLAMQVKVYPNQDTYEIFDVCSATETDAPRKSGHKTLTMMRKSYRVRTQSHVDVPFSPVQWKASERAEDFVDVCVCECVIFE